MYQERMYQEGDMAATRFFTGLDLGQIHDFSTLAVVERVECKGDWDGAAFAWKNYAMLRLRYLERIPLGTSYPDVVSRAVQVTRAGAMEGACELLVDATGVGRPVVDLLRRAGLRCTLTPAIITGGTSETCVEGFRRIPKTNLITGLQLTLQHGTLQIAGGLKFGPALMAEMADMRVKITAHPNGEQGHEQFGAWREGTHDDLVFAVALACWGARRAYPGDAGRRQKYWGGA
jgi:hypothetical protein